MIQMNDFSPPSGFATICERNAILIYIIPNQETKETKIFPDEYFSSDKIADSRIQHSELSSGFLRNQMPFHVKLISGWYNYGFSEFLNILSNEESNFTIVKALSKIAKYGLKICRLFSSNDSLHSILQMNNSSIDRQILHVKFLAWHPQSSYLAIVNKNDCIKVHKYDNIEESKLLHHAQQINVNDIAWRPMHFILAVACKIGIFIWDLETKKNTNLNLLDYKILKHDGHTPITSISWQPCGTLLASSSINDSSILIWNLEMETFTLLKRLYFDRCPLVCWSPNGARLFSSSVTSKFRIWETRTFSQNSWIKIHKRCQTCCWSPNGRILLFTSSDFPMIYCLNFKDSWQGLEEEGHILPVINVKSTTYIVDEITTHVGGLVELMEWDPHGERLAIIFKDDSKHIALFHTRFSPQFSALPIGFITGFKDESAVRMKFMPSFESGSLLTIAWSSGRLSHIPLYYTPSKSKLSSFFSQHVNINDNLEILQHY